MNPKIKDLIEDLESEIIEISDLVNNRIETAPLFDEDDRATLKEDVFNIFPPFAEDEDLAYHAYDIGRLEALNEIVAELKKLKND
jgi:hypothetical protein